VASAIISLSAVGYGAVAGVYSADYGSFMMRMIRNLERRP